MSATSVKDLVTPHWRQSAKEIQKYGSVIADLPIGLDEDVRAQLTERLNLVLADTITLRDLAKKASELGDDGTNDLLVSDVLRTNELQVWFVSEHLVEMPLVLAK